MRVLLIYPFCRRRSSTLAPSNSKGCVFNVIGIDREKRVALPGRTEGIFRVRTNSELLILNSRGGNVTLTGVGGPFSGLVGWGLA